MATVTGFTAARMLAIENATIVDAEIVEDDLIFTRHDETTFNAGLVRGPQGVPGMGPGMIPGEIRLWGGSALPDPEVYSTWVWADGAAYLISNHPLAASMIAEEWRTFGGASDPGEDYFRVPDMRGAVAAGMDAMPGGSSANRMVRSAADDIAGLSGEEKHALIEAELAEHAHTVSGFLDGATYPDGNVQTPLEGATLAGADFESGSTGSGTAHENVQPTVFIPFIVCLDE